MMNLPLLFWVAEEVGDPQYHQAPLDQAVKMVRPAGRIVTAGLGEQLSAVHFKTMVLKEAQIIATRVTLGEFPPCHPADGEGIAAP